jgi:hypothetical protein
LNELTSIDSIASSVENLSPAGGGLLSNYHMTHELFLDFNHVIFLLEWGSLIGLRSTKTTKNKMAVNESFVNEFSDHYV